MDLERELLSDFSDYIHDHKSRSNPNIEVSLTDKESHRYLIVKLNNVRKADEEFCKMIKLFRPGTKYVFHENPEANSFIHVAHIPLRPSSSSRPRSRHKSSKAQNMQKPVVVNLFGAIIILMATIGIGQYVTTPNDWWGIF